MRILLALDHSTASVRAAWSARRIFGRGEPEYHVVNVAREPVPWVAAGPGYGSSFPVDPDELRLEAGQDSRERIGEVAQVAGIPDPQVEVVRGDPASEICEAAERHDVDVVVVGAHDKSILQRLFDPAVSTGVIRGTTRPVLVVRSDD
jgi:nucleotide-binding universal stress UspA family protein